MNTIIRGERETLYRAVRKKDERDDQTRADSVAGKPKKTRLTMDKSQALSRRMILLLGAATATAAIASHSFWAGGSGDQITQQDLDRMNASWNAAIRDRVELPFVTASEMQSALEMMKLPKSQRSDLENSVQNGQANLVWLTLWDTMSEDGDVASIESEGLKIVVPLLKGKTRIAIPRPMVGVVNLTGIRDGGGGVTVGVMSGAREVLIPPLTEGQVVGIPVPILWALAMPAKAGTNPWWRANC